MAAVAGDAFLGLQVGELGDFVEVRSDHQQGGEEVLGCGAAEATARTVFEGVGAAVLEVGVERLDAVPAVRVDRAPFLRPVLEVLGELRPGARACLLTASARG